MALEAITDERKDEFSQALTLIVELARAAKAGDGSAQLELDYLKNVQLAMNENLRLQAESIHTQIFVVALANSAARIAAMR